MIANINNTTDGQTLVVDLDGDKQFDNPWDMNDASFPLLLEILTMKQEVSKIVLKQFMVWAYALSHTENESVDSDTLVDGIENEMVPNTWYRAFPEISAIDYIVFGLISLFCHMVTDIAGIKLGLG